MHPLRTLWPTTLVIASATLGQVSRTRFCGFSARRLYPLRAVNGSTTMNTAPLRNSRTSFTGRPIPLYFGFILPRVAFRDRWPWLGAILCRVLQSAVKTHASSFTLLHVLFSRISSCDFLRVLFDKNVDKIVLSRDDSSILPTSIWKYFPNASRFSPSILFYNLSPNYIITYCVASYRGV